MTNAAIAEYEWIRDTDEYVSFIYVLKLSFEFFLMSFVSLLRFIIFVRIFCS